jgi:hypothetical protein
MTLPWGTQIGLGLMILLCLMDAFDRLFASTALRIDGNAGFVTFPSDRLFCWGIITNVMMGGCVPSNTRDLRFFVLKLPIRTWGLVSEPWIHPHLATYGLRTHRLRWIEGGRENPSLGFHIIPQLE